MTVDTRIRGFDYRKGHTGTAATNAITADIDVFVAPTDYNLIARQIGFCSNNKIQAFHGATYQWLSVTHGADSLMAFENREDMFYLGRKINIAGVEHICKKYYLADPTVLAPTEYIGWGGNPVVNATGINNAVQLTGLADGEKIAIGFRGQSVSVTNENAVIELNERLEDSGIRGEAYELEIDLGSVDYTTEAAVITPSTTDQYIIESVEFTTNGTDVCNITMNRGGSVLDVPMWDLGSVQEMFACANSVRAKGNGFSAFYKLSPRLFLLDSTQVLNIHEVAASNITMNIKGVKLIKDEHVL